MPTWPSERKETGTSPTTCGSIRRPRSGRASRSRRSNASPASRAQQGAERPPRHGLVAGFLRRLRAHRLQARQRGRAPRQAPRPPDGRALQETQRDPGGAQGGPPLRRGTEAELHLEYLAENPGVRVPQVDTVEGELRLTGARTREHDDVARQQPRAGVTGERRRALPHPIRAVRLRMRRANRREARNRPSPAGGGDPSPRTS